MVANVTVSPLSNNNIVCTVWMVVKRKKKNYIEKTDRVDKIPQVNSKPSSTVLNTSLNLFYIWLAILNINMTNFHAK